MIDEQRAEVRDACRWRLHLQAAISGLLPASDSEEELQEHAFYFVRDASRLDADVRYCIPSDAADEENRIERRRKLTQWLPALCIAGFFALMWGGLQLDVSRPAWWVAFQRDVFSPVVSSGAATILLLGGVAIVGCWICGIIGLLLLLVDKILVLVGRKSFLSE